MLCLTRKAGERLFIDGGIEIIVLGHERGHTRLGIIAPPGVRVFREELLSEGDPRRRGDEPRKEGA